MKSYSSHHSMLNPHACCTPIKLTRRNSPVIGKGKSTPTIAATQPMPDTAHLAHLMVGPMPYERPQG